MSHRDPIKRRTYHRKYMRAYTLRWRRMIIAALGGKCVHCGFVDERALQIDHVAGGGCREIIKASNHTAYYKKVLQEVAKGSNKYQLLCANCNWIKRYENDEVQKAYL